MKKTTVLIGLLLITAFSNSCHVRRKVQQTLVNVDSSRLTTTDISAKSFKKDSNSFDFFNTYLRKESNYDLTVDKITKRVEFSEPENLRFVFNVAELDLKGDTAVAVDTYTGTKAVISKDSKTGQLRVCIKPKGQTRTDTYEISGLNLRARQKTDSGSTKVATKVDSQQTTAVEVSSKDSSALSTSIQIREVDVKKDFGILKVIGLCVAGIALLRLTIYLLRNAFPWIGWLNKFLSFKIKR